MRYRFTSLRRTSEPAALAVSRTTAKAHLRVSHTDEDSLIDLYVGSAVRFVEDAVCRALITQTWTVNLDGFCGDIVLPRPPAASISTFTYLDSSNVSATVSSSLYTLDTSAEPAVIRLKRDQDWPDTYDANNSVTVVYTCGYGASETSVPEALKAAILLLVGHSYENREAINIGNIVNELPLAVDRLLAPYRVLEI